MTSIDNARRDIHNETSYQSRNQAALEGAALRGELGIDAQLRAMSEQAKALRAAGDEAGYQAMRTEAYRIYAASQVEEPTASEAAVCGALERLAQESAQTAQLARVSSDKDGAKSFQREANAYVKALLYYRAGVRPTPTERGWMLPSQRSGEPPHLLTMDGDWVCTCQAGGSAHWARNLVIGIEVAGDDLDRFDGGDVEPADEEEEAEDYSIQYEDVPYPHGIGNPDAAEWATMGRRLCAARSKLLEAA